MNKDKVIHIRIDANLYQQLKRYADRNDESLISVSARRAIKQLLNSALEEATKNTNRA
jgi:hypothetical protein